MSAVSITASVPAAPIAILRFVPEDDELRYSHRAMAIPRDTSLTSGSIHFTNAAGVTSLIGAENLFDLRYVGAIDNLPVDHEKGRADTSAPGLLADLLVDLE